MVMLETEQTDNSKKRAAAKQENESICTGKVSVAQGQVAEPAMLTTTSINKKELENLLEQERERRQQLERQMAFMQIASQQQQEMLLATKNKMVLAAGLAKLGIWEYDPTTKLFEFGDEFYALYATNAEREGRFMSFEQYIKEFVYPEDYWLFEEEKEFLISGTGESIFKDFGHRIVRRDGIVRYIVVRRKIARDANENVVRIYGTNQDVTEWVNAEQERQQQAATIKNMAYFDSLTGLPNRQHLNEWLTKELDTARQQQLRGVVMFIDLDDLKMLNDTCGHSFGDKIIIAAGKRIVDVIGNKGFVARVGGDEFVVVLSGRYEREAIEDIAHKIGKALGKSQRFFGKNFHLAASIGIALYPEHGDTTEEIIKNADNAMYAAKKFSKNCWRFYEEEMQIEAQKKMQLIGSLRYALQRGEFSLVYQPQILTSEQKIVGFEALLRWRNHEYGIISPLQFIPLAEQSGLIHGLGKWVLLEAGKFIRRLTEAGYPEIQIAVNISAKQIIADDFITIVRNTIKETGIKAAQLELEITESVLLTSMEEVIKKLNKLKKLGVKISLDDFGTGFSSLTYLRMLPVETLKIDKSFIDIITTDMQGAKIIDSIINMAHTVNMKVVAEGVETQQQLEYLQHNNCDLIQGYIFSQPIGAEKALALLVQGKNMG